MNNYPRFLLFSPRLLILSTTFVTCLLISNIIAGKLIEIVGVALPASIILFPITYILADVFTEVYGFERARLIIWLGFAANTGTGDIPQTRTR